MKIRRIRPNPPVDVSILRFQSPVPEAEPRNILEKIVWQKEKEVEQRRDRLPLLKLRQQVAAAAPPTRDFLAALGAGKTDPALIAELKKASPSKGVIREDFDLEAIATTYEAAGASCLSVLTDSTFFQGSFENLARARKAVDLPLLCKEFVIYPYQILQARLHGADAVLLIAAILEDVDLAHFVKIVHALGMTALVEVHTLEELDRVLAVDGVRLIGINNRNLEDFTVDLQTTCDLLAARREAIAERDILIVSESGLHQPEDIARVKAAGARATLIGESLLVQPDPAVAIAKLFPQS
ncbi:MAG: indole-3-glycerol phosphate synthase TrpC [Cyanobacteria bacterium J06641_5]